MNCRDLHDFVDVAPLRLGSERQLHVARAHADACPGCAAHLAAAESLERALGSLATIASPDRLRVAVMERVGRDSPERPVASEPVPQASRAGAFVGDWAGRTAAVAGSLALLAAYFDGMSASVWLSDVLSPALGLRVERMSSMMDPGSGLLIAAAGILLFAVGILSLAGGSERQHRPTG